MVVVLVVVLALMMVPAQGGRVSGVMRTEAGTPAAGLRVAAMLSADNPAEPSGALVSLSETDSEGRYVLENIPPGRYHITAGRVDRPTFYPGTLEKTSATIVELSPGATVSAIDFTLMDSSARLPQPGPSPRQPINWTMPIDVTIEGGGALPEAAGNKVPMIRLVGNAGQSLQTPLYSARIVVPIVSGITEEYRVQIDDLPDGYVVKSVRFDSTDLVADKLKVSAHNLRLAVPLRIITFTGKGATQEAVDRATQRIANESNRLSITLVRYP